MLEQVKTGLGITGTYQDNTIQTYIDEVVSFLKGMGISETTIQNNVGIVTRGVADTWNYGAGSAGLSTYFMQRATQLALSENTGEGAWCYTQTNIDILEEINSQVAEIAGQIPEEDFKYNIDVLKSINNLLKNINPRSSQFTTITGHPFEDGTGESFDLTGLSIKDKIALTFTTAFVANGATLVFKVNGNPVLEFVNIGVNTSAVYNFEMENLGGLIVLRLSRVDGYNNTVADIQRMIYTDWGTITSIGFEATGNGYSTDTVYYGSYR